MPKLAETEFQRLCDLQNVVRNKAFDDQTGWDFMLEISRVCHAPVAHDKRPGNVTARVQIKSVNEGKAETRLKLTNALHFTREPDFCFIVLFQYSADGAKYRLFARHFERELMSAALKAARKADADGRDELHRIQIPIRFTDEDDHTNDLIDWLRSICNQSPQDYAKLKRQWEQSLGYEKVVATTTFTIDPEHLQAFIDSSAGLKSAVPVTHALLQDVRFGIAGRNPIFDGSGSIIEVSVAPRPATLIAEGVGGISCAFDGEFRMGLPVVPESMACATFFSSCIRLVIRGYEDFNLNFEWDSNTRYSLEQIKHICRFQAALRRGAKLRLDVEGKTILTLPSPPQTVPQDQRLDKLEFLVGTILAACPDKHACEFSLREFADGWDDAMWFAQMTAAGNFSATTTLVEGIEPMPPLKNYVGYVGAEIGGRGIWAIFRRPCMKQNQSGSTVNMVFGDPVILEGGIDELASDMTSTGLEAGVIRWVARLGDGCVTFNEGDPRLAAPDEDLRIAVG